MPQYYKKHIQEERKKNPCSCVLNIWRGYLQEVKKKTCICSNIQYIIIPPTDKSMTNHTQTLHENKETQFQVFQQKRMMKLINLLARNLLREIKKNGLNVIYNTNQLCNNKFNTSKQNTVPWVYMFGKRHGICWLIWLN